uniref:Uncharacterized protein n=1 Tax=Trieres chinensis TaxID=1514140 RepID=A0A7S1ZBV1_TRICV|mmetsp:Transcript_22192/g.44901  ORF Transcript_22192/g.44901 Transcript_22192/m.44901 type:complete len:342 (+) Transcript_22192:490-1515(+)|eukprot:CAMPEP_0183293356 /NCGR_PEP_ID=MMETSP0160_2-20130417/2067_1 /TAXON_ID=2839 ORGANISM="Odontella Sinensis, Strain Grunow 1884" /NCGR_SAMPLE_ID=MMETSP0160_2 /ASSEMBLY_ACC=CAM_ASM_000250 /LENGTH=341 /DNA_ID=CAMNT_0025454459 /DNA_START=486 /DNA_END=1511 /DNA_ORIENTATION=+
MSVIEVVYPGCNLCTLCGTGEMPDEKTLSSHLNGERHNHSLRLHWGKRAPQVSMMEKDISQLGLPRWQWHVRSLLHEYVMALGSTIHTQACHKLYMQACRQLQKYTKMEKTSLLELAIWKASICNGLIFSTMAEFRECKVLEEGFGEDAYMADCRIGCGGEVIIERVLAFLPKSRTPPSQYLNTPIIKEVSPGCFVCSLCGTGIMNSRSNLSSHTRSLQHQTNLHGLVSENGMGRRAWRVSMVEKHVSQLGLPRWQWHVRSLLHEYIVTSDSKFFTQACQDLQKYTKMEKTSLLELAIWKARICKGLIFQECLSFMRTKFWRKALTRMHTWLNAASAVGLR